MSRILTGARGLLRLVAAIVWTFVSYGTALLGSPVLAWNRRRRAALEGWAFRLWSHGLCAIFGLRVRTTGRPPKPPFVLVSNHLSYADIFVLGTAVRCVFVAKAEIDSWPIFGAMCRVVNTIFIDRKTKRDLPKILGMVRRALDEGQGVAIFAEGTSTAGANVAPFRSPLLELPVQLGLPVHHAAISYRTRPNETPAFRSVCWWGDEPLLPHLKRFLALSRVEVDLAFGDDPIAAPDRKHLAALLHLEVSARFRPVVSAVELAAFEPPWRKGASEIW